MTFSRSNDSISLFPAIKTIAPDAPVQADLRRKLDAVTAEQEDRTNLAAHA